MNDNIEVTGVNLVELVKKAYDLSIPSDQDRDYSKLPLTDSEAAAMIDLSVSEPVEMCYVKGRNVSLQVLKDSSDRLFISNSWFSHTDEQLTDLLAHVGIVQ